MNQHRLILFLLFCISAPILMPADVSADRISAVADLSYSDVREETEGKDGSSTDSSSRLFFHRYFLNLDKTIYPNLQFLTGGIFDQLISRTEVDDMTSRSKSTTRYGFADLRLSTRPISSGLGYSTREEKVKPEGQPSVESVRENYTAKLGLRPEGFPQIDTLFLRTYDYDKERVSQDIETDFLSVGLVYEPIRRLRLNGLASFSDRKDKLQELEVDTANYSGRITYAHQFGARVSATTTYSVSHSETKTSSVRNGEVLFPVFPFSGLSVLSDTPELVLLDLNSAVIDVDLISGAGINIGPPPPGGDIRLRNIGLDFVVESEVNTLYVWVDRQLPAVVSNFFSWDVYVSNDNLNWTLFRAVSSATFGTFDNRFEITFPNVTTRYIKVVTRPLPLSILPPPGFDVSNIFVTELQAFLRRPAGEVTGKTTNTSHVYDLGVKWRIMDIPNLTYDFYFWMLSAQPGGSRHLIINGLNISRRLSAIFTGAARIAREDGEDQSGRRSANVYSASVTAVPLPTLYNSLVVSGRFEEEEDGDSNTHSLFTNNTAELYKGLTFNLSGGLSVATSIEDRRTVSTILNSSLSALPHPALNINLGYSQNLADQTGGGREDSSTYSRTGHVSVAYTPFRSLYLFASFSRYDQKDRDATTLQNYVLNWSPFAEGDLQLNFAYYENINSDGTKERTITPGMRLYLRRNATLDVSYTMGKSSTDFSRTDSKVFSANLRMTLL